MAYLIIFLVIALIIPPIMALKPNPTQNRQKRLRERAREQGLLVQLVGLPQTHRQAVRREETANGVMYRLPWRHPVGKRRQFEFLLDRRETEPQRIPPAILEPLQKTLTALPETVVAVAFSHQGVAVYWREAGDESSVDHIAEQLRVLQQTLQDLPAF